MIDTRSIQRTLAELGTYTGKIDGDFGPKSRAARDEVLAHINAKSAEWGEERRMVAIAQWVMWRHGINAGPIDGLRGPTTEYALEQWQNKMRDAEVDETHVAHQPTVFPRQRDMKAFYGPPGQNHTMMTLPYEMRLAWDPSVKLSRITINLKCADSAERALLAAREHYGIGAIRELGLDMFGGCYNNRKMRGGTTLSTHAFAAAIDIDPANNQLRWGRDRARLATPECRFFLDAFEREGWVSLGRERNYDWMHLQAARL